MAKNKKGDAQSAGDLVNLISYIVREELNKRDTTVLAKIVRYDNVNNTYDLYVEPDTETIVHNISAITGIEKLNPGDYVYVFKINNQFNKSFIIKKV